MPKFACISYLLNEDSIFEISDARQMELFKAEILTNIEKQIHFSVVYW